MEKAISGFRAAGIVPFNPDKFSAEDFAPEKDFEELVVEAKPENESDHLNFTTESVGPPVTVVATIPDFSNAGPSDVNVTDVAPIRKQSLEETGRKINNRKQHSQILTSTPLKEELEKKKRKRLEKLDKNCKGKRKLNLGGEKKIAKRKVKKRNPRQIEETDESDMSEDICDDSDTDDLLCDKNNEKCIICEEFGRDGEEWFRCVSCGFWSHADCSGWDTADEYSCDICLKKEKKLNKCK